MRTNKFSDVVDLLISGLEAGSIIARHPDPLQLNDYKVGIREALSTLPRPPEFTFNYDHIQGDIEAGVRAIRGLRRDIAAALEIGLNLQEELNIDLDLDYGRAEALSRSIRSLDEMGRVVGAATSLATSFSWLKLFRYSRLAEVDSKARTDLKSTIERLEANKALARMNVEWIKLFQSTLYEISRYATVGSDPFARWTWYRTAFQIVTAQLAVLVQAEAAGSGSVSARRADG